MITYKLLDTCKGIIITREPQSVVREIEFNFGLLDVGATAIFGFSDGRTSYKKLTEGVCRLPLWGEETISVCIAILNGDADPVVWKCESIKVKQFDGNVYFVMPDDIGLQDKFIELSLENESIRAELKALQEKYSTLSRRIDELLEGYDLV